MKWILAVVVVVTNLVAIFCLFNPWIADWAGPSLVFLVVEIVSLVLIGVPVFVHQRRKGLAPGQALFASVDTVMGFLSGWV
jgi:hypothetical protein